MSRYPRPILELIAQFTRLPGIGPKTAERLTLHLAAQPKTEVERLAHAVSRLAENVHACRTCGNYAEADPCPICRDSSRDGKLLCVVAKPQDLVAIERTGEFHGRYHLLGGIVNPLEGITLERLGAEALVERIKRDEVGEVVLAFNPDVAGEGTVLALKNMLQPLVQTQRLKITKLARGLPLGSDVEYADEVTLSHAMKGRHEV